VTVTTGVANWRHLGTASTVTRPWRRCRAVAVRHGAVCVRRGVWPRS